MRWEQYQKWLSWDLLIICITLVWNVYTYDLWSSIFIDIIVITKDEKNLCCIDCVKNGIWMHVWELDLTGHQRWVTRYKMMKTPVLHWLSWAWHLDAYLSVRFSRESKMSYKIRSKISGVTKYVRMAFQCCETVKY